MTPSGSLALALIVVPKIRYTVALFLGEVMVTEGGALLGGGTTLSVTDPLVVTSPSLS